MHPLLQSYRLPRLRVALKPYCFLSPVAHAWRENRDRNKFPRLVLCNNVCYCQFSTDDKLPCYKFCFLAAYFRKIEVNFDNLLYLLNLIKYQLKN